MLLVGKCVCKSSVFQKAYFLQNVKCFQNYTIRVGNLVFLYLSLDIRNRVLNCCCLVFWYLEKKQLYKTPVMVEITCVNFEIYNHLNSYF